MASDEHTKISDRSWIPLGKAIAIGSGLFFGGWVVAIALSRIEHRIERMEETAAERWTVTDMERWSWAVRENNRQIGQQPLWMPDPREIRRLPDRK